MPADRGAPGGELLQQGMVLDQAGRHDEAAGLYRRAVVETPRNPYAWHLLGAGALRRGDAAEAVEQLSRAIELKSDEPVFHDFLGQAFQHLGSSDKALAAYSQAVELNPAYLPAMYRRALLLLRSTGLASALADFGSVVRADSKYAGLVLQQADKILREGRAEQAGRLARHVVENRPDFRDAHMAQARALLAQGQFDRVAAIYDDWFRRERGAGVGDSPFDEKQAAAPAGTPAFQASAFFFENLAGHIRYLIGQGKLDTSYSRLADKCVEVVESSERSGTGLITVDAHQAERIGGILGRALHHADSAPLAGAAVNPELDCPEIQKRFAEAAPRMTWFDDFLSPDALHSLRAFCLESTMFFRLSHNHFVSSYLEEGFSCSVLFQLAAELKVRFPDVLGPLQLQNIWCYRQAPEGDGVRPHSDQAEVTFNFWITPDDANLDPEHGGLVVYDREQPLDWDWQATNRDKDNPAVLKRIEDYLANAETTAIPYRENRAVMFYSNLFHRSDRFRFKPGYENSRMNITLLFGHHASRLPDE